MQLPYKGAPIWGEKRLASDSEKQPAINHDGGVGSAQFYPLYWGSVLM